jgi:1-pyrroline dehydrogenase
MTILNFETRHFIDGEWLADSAQSFPILNPATGAPITAVGGASRETVDRAVEAATFALPTWRRTTPKERSDVLLALAELAGANVDELAALDSLNVGKPLSNAVEEIHAAVDVLRFIAGTVRSSAGADSGEYLRNRTSLVRREPIGVVGLILPWNCPFLELSWKLSPALAAGNTVVLKPSEMTPLSALKFAELSRDVLPRGVLNVVNGAGDTGAALVAHPGVGAVSLTGDVGTGRKVAAAAAQTLKRVHLELGGKAPVLVFDDADVDKTATTLAEFGFVNSGQDCTAPCRLLVHTNVYDRFVEVYLARVGKLRVGDPSTDTVDLGPVVSEHQRGRVTGFIDRARESGADVRVQLPVPAQGFFISPTVVLDPAQDSEIVQNEVFGPVVTIQRANDEAHMLSMANDTRYGLASSVWTEDLRRAHRVAQDLEFGTVWVNEHFALPSETPFGGFGDSGYGKELSAHSIDEYSRFKHIMINTSVD